MTDGVCGAATTGEAPCQNPTTDEGDAGRCWIPSHNDPDAENPHGRHFAIDADDHDDILEAAELGASLSGCARAAGTGIDSLQRYLDAHGDFREAFTRARAKGEQRLIREPLYDSDDPASPDMDGQHARFLLKTSFKYAEKTELEDVTEGDGGFGTTVVLDSEYVTDE